jgi:membrane associated rhomboid family serine protease
MTNYSKLWLYSYHLFYVSNNANDDGNNNNNPADSPQRNPLSSLLPLQSSEPQSSSLLFESLTRLFTSMFVHATIAHIAFSNENYYNDCFGYTKNKIILSL